MKNSYKLSSFKNAINKTFTFAEEERLDLDKCSIMFSEDLDRGLSVMAFDNVSQRYFGVGIPLAHVLP